MEIPDPDRAHPEHLRGSAPDRFKGLVPHIAARDRHGDARLNVTVGADVTGIVRSAARNLVEVRADGRGFADIGFPDIRVQDGILQHAKKLFTGNPELDRGGIAIVLRRNHGVKATQNAEPFGESPDLLVLPRILSHERAVQLHRDARGLEQLDALKRPLKGARDLGDPRSEERRVGKECRL